MSQEIDALNFFAKLLEAAEQRQEDLEKAYFGLRDLGLLSRVQVHRYQCRRGCQVAQVYKHGGRIFAYAKPYKYSPGLNAASSVPEARLKNTLDGDRHWPSHIYDVHQLAEWGTGTGAHVACRHFHGLLEGERIMGDIHGVRPGKPGAPSILAAP